MKDLMLSEVDFVHEFMMRALRPLEEADSNFKPTEESYSVAAQVMHIALTVDWFREGAFGSGFTMDFEEHDRQAKACTSLEAAKKRFTEEIEKFKEELSAKTEEELWEHYPEGSIIEGPKAGIGFSLADHCAHHRGSLMVYIRLLGKTPVMPYMDM